MAATVTLPALLALFKIDRDLHILRTGLDNVQRDQKRQLAKIADLTRSLETQESANMKLQAEVGGKELELKTRQQHIEKMRESLNTTKTNKEYSAILVTISGEKSEVAKLETATFEQMQTVESNAKALDAIRQQIAGEKVVLAKIESEQGEKVSTLQQQIREAEARRAEAAKAVPAEPLRQYDRISQKYPGDAMAPVNWDENDHDDVSCGACFMGLNVEHVNLLRGRDELRRCNSCNRILYLPEMMPV